MPREVTQGSTGVGQKAERGREVQGPEPLLGLSWEAMGEAG